MNRYELEAFVARLYRAYREEKVRTLVLEQAMAVLREPQTPTAGG